MATLTGGCQCGRVRYRAEVASRKAYLCHCRMCQRAAGSVSLALFNLKQADVRWLGEPDWYRSSPFARRPFCSACGTSLGFAFDDSENMDLTVGSFDEPGHFRPTSHFGAELLHEAWLNTSDLPRHRCEENPVLVERWEAVGGDVNAPGGGQGG